jgi:hypothetical protein
LSFLALGSKYSSRTRLMKAADSMIFALVEIYAEGNQV